MPFPFEIRLPSRAADRTSPFLEFVSLAAILHPAWLLLNKTVFRNMGIFLALGLLLLATSGNGQARIDCNPEPGSNQQSCEARGCIWSPGGSQDPAGIPWCFFKNGVGYKFVSQSLSTITLTKNNGPTSPWGADIKDLTLSTSTIGATLNVRITTATGSRYEPPINLPRDKSSSSDQVYLKSNTASDPFSFEVVRKSTSRKLFDTSLGGLIFCDQFIQIVTTLPSDNMYGWGENIHQNIKHDFSRYLTWGMLARDEPPNSAGTDTKNLYGVQPFYMIMEPDGKAHGVLILNSNPQEVTTAPGPTLIYRTIGGMLDMYFFPGPSPADVIQQYQALIGKPFLPAYWGLGYQFSRYGYKDLNDLQSTITRITSAGIPIDTAVIDIDYMERYKDFTIGQQNWAGLPGYVNQIRSNGMRLIPIFDPAIQVDYDVFQRGLNQNARFIEWERMDQVMHPIQDQYPLAKNTKIMLGVVWPDHHVAFPDFFDPTNATHKWWISEFVNFYKQLTFDGIWIDMNEPSNFGTNDNHPWYYDSSDHPNDLPLFCPMQDGSKDSQYDMPPYKTHNVWNYGDNSYLATKTLCLLAVQANGAQRHFDVKNLYGWSEARSTQQALFAATGKRGVVISRSTFPSSGRYTGHWLGDNTARWEDLRTSVIGAQEFNLFGIPYVGSDVCGFIGTTNEELCLRWQQMGAFHSFFRNHNANDNPPQDPTQWPSVTAATKKANLFRYRYLPYLFTLHHLASSNGGTVIRPMFFEYPHDGMTYNLGYQFMWGPSIMVAPVLYQGATTVDLYIPDGSFYSLFDYNYGRSFEAGHATVPAPQTSQIPTFVKSGSIIPRQVPSTTTSASRKNPFEVLVVPDSNMAASGNLRWDDGESVIQGDVASSDYWDLRYTFVGSASRGNFSITAAKSGTISLPTLDTLEFFNFPAQPDYNSFQLNGKKINVNVQSSAYSPITRILTISTSKLITLSSFPQTLTWTNLASIDMGSMDQDGRLRYRY